MNEKRKKCRIIGGMNCQYIGYEDCENCKIMNLYKLYISGQCDEFIENFRTKEDMDNYLEEFKEKGKFFNISKYKIIKVKEKVD